MKTEKFILGVLKKIESLSEGIIAFAYKAKNNWWEIAVSDFDLYSGDKRFKALSQAWHKAMNAQGKKVIFVCRTPKEKQLAKLATENNLILNL